MSEPIDEVAPIEAAARLTGVPARTLRSWVKAGRLVAVPGERGRLVKLEDVWRLAGASPQRSTSDEPTRSLVPAESVRTLEPRHSAAEQLPLLLERLAELEQLPRLVNHIAELERRLGRLEAERDEARHQAHRLEAELETSRLQSSQQAERRATDDHVLLAAEAARQTAAAILEQHRLNRHERNQGRRRSWWRWLFGLD